MDLSIIIPAYKSKDIVIEQLPVLKQWLKGWKYKTEIIVVVDGEKVCDYSDVADGDSVVVTGYETNRGKGFAIKYGFKKAKAPLILYTDADVPFSQEDMLRMAGTLEANSHRNVWVIGDRTLPDSKYFEHTLALRKAGSNLLLLIIKHTLGKDFADTQCGLKGFTRGAGECVFSKSLVNRFAFDFECLYIARQKKIDVLKIPVSLRNQSPSTVRLYRDGMRLLKDVLKILFWYRYA